MLVPLPPLTLIAPALMICEPLTVSDVFPLRFSVFPLASWRSSILALISSATVLLPSAMQALVVELLGTPLSQLLLLQLPLPAGVQVDVVPPRPTHCAKAVV